jgi:hypothetical protein
LAGLGKQLPSVVLAVVCFTIAFQPFSIARLLVFAPAWVAATIAATWVARRFPAPLVRRLRVIVWNLCILLIVVEIGLEVMVRTMPSPLFAKVQEDVESLVRLKTQHPGWMFLGFPFNKDGWYDEELSPKSPDQFRVVSISDSFAWGTVPHHYHFTTVCERLAPGSEVLNLGLSATGPDVYEYILRHYGQPLDPDLIVVNLFIGNDLQELIGIKPNPWPGRVFDRERLLTYRISKRLLILSRESKRKAADVAAVTARMAATSPVENRILIRPGERIVPQHLAEVFPWLDDPPLEPPVISSASFAEIEVSRARATCHAFNLAPQWQAEFFLRMRRIAAAAGHTPILFVLIPDEFQVEEEVWQIVESASPEGLDRFRPQELLSEWCALNGLSWIDLLPYLRAAPPLEDGGRHVYHRQDTHFNRRGHEIAGRVLAEEVRRRMEAIDTTTMR